MEFGEFSLLRETEILGDGLCPSAALSATNGTRTRWEADDLPLEPRQGPYIRLLHKNLKNNFYINP